LFSSKALKPMSGSKKKAYKYYLCGIFLNLVGGYHTTSGQKQNISLALYIKNTKLNRQDYEDLSELAWQNLELDFEKNKVKKPYDDNLINTILAFTRVRIDEIEEKGVSLFQAEQIKGIIDYHEYTGHPSLRDFHWFEFDINRGIFPTIPQMIIFNDLKAHWNVYIDLMNQFSGIKKKVVTHKERFDAITDKGHREFEHKLGAMQRNLVFLAVTFVEACLYDFFYNIKSGNLPEKEKVISVLELKKTNDKTIVEDIIYKMYPEVKIEVEPLYAKYKEVLHYRDRYVHASPFIDESSNTSQLQPLLEIRKSKAIDFLQDSYNFINKINEILPDHFKILFWMFDKVVDFYKEETMPLTNEGSRLSKHAYEEI
ncbi:hypothetical protein V7111_26970, partial [Neobacillus niacini]|uniref:hypothetical protein n=1 Tax=Neobacillus niacini TaxID=86668 RepID=UPI00300354DD